MNHDSYADAYISDILLRHRSIAMVGASPKPERPSAFAMKYLMSKGYRVIPVNPGQAGEEILGQKVYASLADIEGPVEIVDIFRNSDAALEVSREAIAIGAKVVWMQLGVRNDEAAREAEEAGLRVVMNRCPKIEYARLSGEIGWMGVNRRLIDNRKPLLFGKGGALKRGLTMRVTVALLCLAWLSLLPAPVALADPVDPKPPFIVELQKAVQAGDKNWMAAHLHLPVRYFGEKTQLIRSRAWFLKHYATVMGPELKASVLAQDPEKYFENYQGLMVGEGSRNIWFQDFGDMGAGRGVHFEIITINNSR